MITLRGNGRSDREIIQLDVARHLCDEARTALAGVGRRHDDASDDRVIWVDSG